MSDRATTVIPLPLSVVESNIWDVTTWTAFVAGVERIERVAPERFLFGIRQGRRVHPVPVAVRWHPRDHRVSWRELHGPAWRGEIRLTALNGRRTRIGMEISAHPRTPLAAVAAVLRRPRRDVAADLGRLAERLARIPPPLNPRRLTSLPRPAEVGLPAAGMTDPLASGEVAVGVGVGTDARSSARLRPD
jgi:hypothetical protein